MQKFTLLSAELEDDETKLRIVSIDINAEDGMSQLDVIEAIRKASKEYCSTTDEGMRVYDGNCGAFDYADFRLYVPNDICKKYGIEKVEDLDRVVMDYMPPIGEQLIDEDLTEEIEEDR